MTETDVDADAESSNGQGTAAAADDDDGNQDNRRCQATSMMSRISGVKRGRTASSSSFGKSDVELPTYGVDEVADSVLLEVRVACVLIFDTLQQCCRRLCHDAFVCRLFLCHGYIVAKR